MSKTILDERTENLLISRIEKLEKTIEEMKSNQPPTEMIIPDSTTNRLLLSPSAIKLSQQGFDVMTASDDELILSSEFNMMKIVESGSSNVNVNYVTPGDVIQTFSATVTHNLGYVPIVFGFVDSLGVSGRTQIPQTFYYFGDDFLAFAHIYYYATATTITFNFAMATNAYNGTQTIKYYLMRETT